MESFTLKCRNEEQLKLWLNTMEKYLERLKKKKSKAPPRPPPLEKSFFDQGEEEVKLEYSTPSAPAPSYKPPPPYHMQHVYANEGQQRSKPPPRPQPPPSVKIGSMQKPTTEEYMSPRKAPAPPRKSMLQRQPIKVKIHVQKDHYAMMINDVMSIGEFYGKVQQKIKVQRFRIKYFQEDKGMFIANDRDLGEAIGYATRNNFTLNLFID